MIDYFNVEEHGDFNEYETQVCSFYSVILKYYSCENINTYVMFDGEKKNVMKQTPYQMKIGRS